MPFAYLRGPTVDLPQPHCYLPTSCAAVRASLLGAKQRLDAGQAAEALPLVDEALARDEQPPLLHYLRGRALDKLSRYDEAAAAYAQAREHTVGNLGARLSINERIAHVARDHGSAFVDARALFDEDGRRRGARYNLDLLFDHCHPSARGHQVLADAIAPKF